MEASIVNLRYKMKEVLKALERREIVHVLYRGKIKGTIIPKNQKVKISVKDHPLFGICKDEKISVEEQMNILRGGRYDNL